MEELNPDQELEVLKELDAMKGNPMLYFDIVIREMIKEAKAQSSKHGSKRDYDKAWMYNVRALLAIREMIK